MRLSPTSPTRFVIALLSVSPCLLCVQPLHAQVREDVVFEFTYTPPPGWRVFVLGDLPELGENDVTQAVKLQGPVPLWRITVSLPVNRDYSYRFYERDIAPGAVGNPQNGNPLTGILTASTSSVVLDPSTKRVYYRSTFDPPALHWRQGDGAFETLVMEEVAPGRFPDEKLWRAVGFGEANRTIELFFTNLDESEQDPPGSSHETPLDACFVQDGELFTYVPAASVGAHQRDYDPSDPPVVDSAVLGEERGYRVMLPRGYFEHPARRYPVLYMHDGNDVWDPGPQGTLDADGNNVAGLVAGGRMGEVIQVGIDFVGTDGCEILENRVRDYLPPDDVWFFSGCGGLVIPGEAHLYVAFIIDELKPVIDAEYRTLADADHTFAAGMSAGGWAAMYMGWDYFETFARVGAQSGGAAQNFRNRVASEPWRDIRVYLDSGAGGNYFPQLALRGVLASKIPPYTVEGTLRYFFGAGHQHTWQHFGLRFPRLGTFLYPAIDESNELYDEFRRGDCNTDSIFDLADAIFLLQRLFLGGAAPECDDACDGDDNGLLDLADAISILVALFLNPDPLPAPGDQCGIDATADQLQCASFDSCP